MSGINPVEIKVEKEQPVKVVYVLKLKHAVLRLHRIDEKEINAAKSNTVKQEPRYYIIYNSYFYDIDISQNKILERSLL